MEPAIAYRIASQKHEGQYNRFGDPLIDHLVRVAAAVPAHARATALLHDLLDRCPTARWSLRGKGLTRVELDALKLLTHVPPDRYEDYVSRIADAPGPAGRLARTVKLADLDDQLAHATICGRGSSRSARRRVRMTGRRRLRAAGFPLDGVRKWEREYARWPRHALIVKRHGSWRGALHAARLADRSPLRIERRERVAIAQRLRDKWPSAEIADRLGVNPPNGSVLPGRDLPTTSASTAHPPSCTSPKPRRLREVPSDFKEQVLSIERFDTVEQLRARVRQFARDDNEHWLLERHGYYRSPSKSPRRPHRHSGHPGMIPADKPTRCPAIRAAQRP